MMGDFGYMPVVETYASRVAAAAKADSPDVYIYDELRPLVRKQLSIIFTQCIGPGWREPRGFVPGTDAVPPNANEIWERVARVMNREVESFSLPRNAFAYERCMTYLQRSTDLNGLLSLIEICASIMKDCIISPNAWSSYGGATLAPSEGLTELNERFLRAGVGYQFENGRIIRIDNHYVHAEIVKEALRLLGEPGFQEANEEFMTAHRHLREGRLRDCNTAALRAMENVLKVICDARGWSYAKGDTVERLIAVVLRERLFPDYLGGYFDNLIGAMKAGVPKIRDRQGGHGAAPGDSSVPDHIGAFALHLTAANIVLLVKAHLALPVSPR